MLSFKPACCSALILSVACLSSPAAAVPSGASHQGQVRVTAYDPVSLIYERTVSSQPDPFSARFEEVDPAGSLVGISAGSLDTDYGRVFTGGFAKTEELMAQSLISYNWGVEGPEIGVSVPVTVTFKGYAAAAGNGRSEARLFLLGADAPWIDSVLATSADGEAGKIISFSRVLTVRSGSNVILSMLASSQVNLSGQCSRDAMGSCVLSSSEVDFDPMFTIDPAFAADYHLVGGLFDAVAPSVPEPPEWALLIVGVAAAGAAARCRRAGTGMTTRTQSLG